MSPSMSQRAIGDMLGDRYRIVSLLGEGGFGSVYAADDVESGQRVARFSPTLRAKLSST